MNRHEFFETIFSKPVSVDREKGILRHVKIVGTSSAHKRTYPTAALEKAKRLYEGQLVNNNHFREKGRDLPTDVRFGWLENVSAESDGLYADCHVFDPTEPLARKLFAAAEHKPEAFGFSHHAFGTGRQVGQQFVVEAIESVASVDLVAEPATTKGLFESGTGNRTMKIRDLFEALVKNEAWDLHKRARLKEFLEMKPEEMKEPEKEMAVSAGQEIETPPESASPDTQIDDAFKAMVCGVFDDKSLDARGKIKKITEILKAQERLMGVDEEAASEAAAEGKGDTDSEEKDKAKAEEEKAKGKGDGETDKDKEKMESLTRELVALKAEKAVIALIEAAGLRFTKPEHREAFIESLLPLPDAKRKALIEERRHLTPEAQRRETPRSAPPGAGTGKQNGAGNYESFVESLRSA